jgi:hypothetical protein
VERRKLTFDLMSADPFFHPLHYGRRTAAGEASATDATISTMSAESFILFSTD